MNAEQMARNFYEAMRATGVSFMEAWENLPQRSRDRMIDAMAKALVQ